MNGDRIPRGPGGRPGAPVPTPRILVVDDDPVCSTVVTRALQSRAYVVETAADGRAGLEAAERTRPDLILTDVEMPGIDGFDMVRLLRARPALALVPVIFFTVRNRAQDRLRGFSLGADDYMAKDSLAAEVAIRVANVLSRRLRSEDVLPAAQAGVKGSLGLIGLASLLQVLDAERRSGTLTLRDGAETGTIDLRDGRIVDAQSAGRRAAQGAPAVYALLGWARGEFEFAPGGGPAEDRIGVATPALLLEAARRQDDSRRGPGA